MHVVVAASILTAAFMLVTANELGPFGPLVIAEAFYLAAFAVTFEAVLLLIWAWSVIRATSRLRAAPSSRVDGAVQ